MLNSDPHISHRSDTQSREVCRGAWTSTFSCPCAAARAGERGWDPPAAVLIVGQKGNCWLEQHKGAPKHRVERWGSGERVLEGNTPQGHGGDAAWLPAPQEQPDLYIQWRRRGRCWDIRTLLLGQQGGRQGPACSAFARALDTTAAPCSSLHDLQTYWALILLGQNSSNMK